MQLLLADLKRSFLLVLLCVVSSPAIKCQFYVFRSFDDMINETPVEYPSFKYHGQKGKSNVIITIQDSILKEKVQIDCSRIWGFSFKGGI